MAAKWLCCGPGDESAVEEFDCGIALSISGRAIAANLKHEEHFLKAAGCEVENPHVTVLFRYKGSDDEDLKRAIARVQKKHHQFNFGQMGRWADKLKSFLT